MKRFAYFWAVLALIALTAGSSFARGNYYEGSHNQNRNNMGNMKGGMFYHRQSPAQMAYRIIVRASDAIYVGESYANSVKDGKLLMRKSKKLFNIAKKLYNQKKYRQSSDYALSSMYLSKSVVHLYRANHQIGLPKPPPAPLAPPIPPQH